MSENIFLIAEIFFPSFSAVRRETQKKKSKFLDKSYKKTNHNQDQGQLLLHRNLQAANILQKIFLSVLEIYEAALKTATRTKENLTKYLYSYEIIIEK